MTAFHIPPAKIAAEATKHYGRRIAAQDLSFGGYDFMGRHRVYAGSLYLGALNERTGAMVYDRQAS